MCADLEIQGWFLLDHRARYDAYLCPKTFFYFIYLSAVCPGLAATLLSVDFLVLFYRLSPSHRCLRTMMTASYASKTDPSLVSGIEGLRRNPAAIRSTPPPSVVGSSLERASILTQGVGGGGCRQSSLDKQVVSGMIVCCVC